MERSYEDRISALHQQLGIPDDYFKRGLPFHREATTLVVGDLCPEGKEMLMEPETAAHWLKMKTKAESEGVLLLIESAFRSVNRQFELVAEEREKGSSLDQALTWIAAPGFSEHHTGRALDIGSPDCFPIPVSEVFENTQAFGWLSKNAGKFGFTLSYPRENPYGIIYEPWHWYFSGK